MSERECVCVWPTDGSFTPADRPTDREKEKKSDGGAGGGSSEESESGVNRCDVTPPGGSRSTPRKRKSRLDRYIFSFFRLNIISMLWGSCPINFN